MNSALMDTYRLLSLNVIDLTRVLSKLSVSICDRVITIVGEEKGAIIIQCNCRMMESGLLPKELAMKVYEKKQKKGLLGKLSTPLKAATAGKSRSQSVTVKKKTRSTPVPCVNKKTASAQKQSKKRKVEDDSDSDSGDDFILPKAKKRREA